MSYSGVTRIDEGVARSDMRKLDMAMARLKESRSTIIRLQQCADGMSGQTGAAISQKAEELRIKVDRLNEKLQRSKELIAMTVREFQTTDVNLSKITGRLR